MNNINLNDGIKNASRNANNGDITACYELGSYLLECNGDINVDRSIELLNQAVSGEHSEAMLVLGKLYFDGVIVPKDKKLGGELIEKSATAGNIHAQRVLGDLIFKAGLHKPELIKHGIGWLRIAAKNGDIVANYILGLNYLNGVGIEKDEREASEYLTSAAEAGYLPAHELLIKHFNYEKRQNVTQTEFMVALNKIPEYFPEPCHIVFLNNNNVDAVIENQLDNDFYVFGMIIENTATLDKAEASILTDALQCQNNYYHSGFVCFSADIAFIFGEGENQIRVLIDLECGWTYIKYKNEILRLGINWQSDCKLKHHKIVDELREKYFPNETQGSQTLVLG